jgi:coenzyme F420-reducing hydrogenase gamma subunit
MVAQDTPCLGPVTQAGCGALCPAYQRGCYGCFGPSESPNTRALSEQWKAFGKSSQDILRAFRTYNAYADAFRKESDTHE